METQFGEQIIPGTYVQVRAEALISAGGVSSGNVGIVGTAKKGTDEKHILSDYATALDKYGDYDAYKEGKGQLNLTRGIELLFRSGARTVYAYAVAAAAAPAKDKFTAGFQELLKDDVNILVAPELSTADAISVLGVVDTAETQGKDAIAVIGIDGEEAADIAKQVTSNKRFVMTTPGIVAFDAAAKAAAKAAGKTDPNAQYDVPLSGRYSAAAVAGLLSSLAPQSSPTNKVLSGVGKLVKRFSYGETKDLVKGGVLVLEERRGVRVVRGLTTEASENGPFSQITTRRITDFAKAGIRQVSNPFIGRLNNERIRKALYGALDGFLASMLQDESLTNYKLEVTATRQDEIAGRAIVNVLMQPTFSIDYIRVTLLLQ